MHVGLLMSIYKLCLPFITLIRRSGHYNAWKVSTWSLPVRIEMLRLMNRMSAKILNFVMGWNKPLKFWKCNQMSQKIMMVSFKTVLYSNSRIFVIPVNISNGRKQTLVDTIGILSALRMRGLHDKRQLLAKLCIAGSENLYLHVYI